MTQVVSDNVSDLTLPFHAFNQSQLLLIKIRITLGYYVPSLVRILMF